MARDSVRNLSAADGSDRAGRGEPGWRVPIERSRRGPPWCVRSGTSTLGALAACSTRTGTTGKSGGRCEALPAPVARAVAVAAAVAIVVPRRLIDHDATDAADHRADRRALATTGQSADHSARNRAAAHDRGGFARGTLAAVVAVVTVAVILVVAVARAITAVAV